MPNRANGCFGVERAKGSLQIKRKGRAQWPLLNLVHYHTETCTLGHPHAHRMRVWELGSSWDHTRMA